MVRVNFKFGQTKSVLFFDDADVDVSPGGGGSMELRFSGVPSRTDGGDLVMDVSALVQATKEIPQ